MLTITLLALSLSGAACGSTAARSPGDAQPGGIRVRGAGGVFAGYVWQNGSVASVSASWRIPTIEESLAAAPAGDSSGSTWIGAQDADGARVEPFIQIGTTEDLNPSGYPKRTYTAFWSDARHSFHPQMLLIADAGDEMAANMRLTDGRWTLSITDRTRHHRRQVSTREEGAAFNLALWLQEDTASSLGNGPVRPLPYPTLSTVSMSALRVNGAAPVADDLASTWMQLPHRYLGPTPLRADGFAVVPQRLSGAGARYLTAAAAFDSAAAGFDDQRAHWTDGTAPATVRRETDRFIAALVVNVDRLRAGPWPAAVAGAVRSLIRIYAPQIPQLRRTAGHGERAVAALMQSFGSLGEIANDDGLVRQALGLPQTQY